MDTRPIGILDSGVGGLTVWKEILTQLPQESTMYVGDSFNAPYGDKNPDEIFSLAKKMIQFLLEKNVKLVVIACNVITTTSLDRLRIEFKDTPIIGTVPVVKMAAEKTKKGRIGILSTNGTARSHYQRHLIEQFASNVEVSNLGTNVLVPLVEKGELVGSTVEAVVDLAIEPFREAKVDVVALGCTHFPFLREAIQKSLGSDVLLLDSGAAIARQVRRILEKNGTLNSDKNHNHVIHTTGDPLLIESIIVQAKLPVVSIRQVQL